MEEFEIRKNKAIANSYKHIGIYENYNYILEDNLNELKSFPEFKWIFKSKLLNYFETTSYATPYEILSFVNIINDEENSIFTFKEIKVVNIQNELVSGNFVGYLYAISALIFDFENTPRKIQIQKRNIENAIIDIIDICEKLMIYRTWIIFDLYQENILLKEKILELENKIQDLNINKVN
jgi:hypothetical protein